MRSHLVCVPDDAMATRQNSCGRLRRFLCRRVINPNPIVSGPSWERGLSRRSLPRQEREDSLRSSSALLAASRHRSRDSDGRSLASPGVASDFKPVVGTRARGFGPERAARSSIRVLRKTLRALLSHVVSVLLLGSSTIEHNNSRAGPGSQKRGRDLKASDHFFFLG